MRRIDDFMVDRVFQPIADRLEVWKNCYGLAAFLATGSIACYLVAFFYPPFNKISVRCVLVILCVCSLSSVRNCHNLERRLATNVVSPDRIAYLPWRMVALVINVQNTMFAVSGTVGGKIYFVAWLAYTCSIYFCACQRRPPRREVSRSPVLSGASS